MGELNFTPKGYNIIIKWLTSMFGAGIFDSRATNKQHCGHMGQFFLTELIVEIYFKNLVRAIGKLF